LAGKRRKDPAAVALGRKGGRVSGIKKGLAAMSPEQRERIRQMAIETRRKNPDKKE